MNEFDKYLERLPERVAERLRGPDAPISNINQFKNLGHLIDNAMYDRKRQLDAGHIIVDVYPGDDEITVRVSANKVFFRSDRSIDIVIERDEHPEFATLIYDAGGEETLTNEKHGLAIFGSYLQIAIDAVLGLKR